MAWQARSFTQIWMLDTPMISAAGPCLPHHPARRVGPQTPRRRTLSPTTQWPCGFCYLAFIVDVFAQRVVAWHAATSKATDLVMTPLRIALWQRDREGHPTVAGELIHHSDAGSQ